MPRPPTKRNRQTSKAVSASSREKPQANTGHDDSSTANTSRSPGANNQDEETSAQRATALRQLRNQTPMARTHEQAIESSPMGERGATGSRPPTRSRGYSSTLSIAGRKGDMSSKIPGTPAFESSILSTFRRRPRQPSILQMMQAEDGSSELDDDDFLGGLSPEDESTPLNLSRRKSLLERNAVSPSPSLPSVSSSNGSRKRKRYVEECQVPQSPSAVVENTPAESPSPEDLEEESCGSPESLRPSESLETFSQTLVPPLSSSQPSSPARPTSTLQPAQPLDAAKEGIEVLPDVTSEVMALPTATLQDRLLPRRRQRHRKRHDVVGFEISSDYSEDEDPALDQDDDELSYFPTRRTARSNLNLHSGARRGNRRTAGVVANKVSGHKGSSGTERSPKQAKRTPRETACLPRSHQAVEKDNHAVDMSSPLSSPLDSDAFESDLPSESPPSVNFLSEELRLQAKKFAEVDKWEMEYEDIPDSQGSIIE
ncbi:hypothetical protein BDV29DRAFT_183612 [Aspergillus leporis]|uniref:Uncharacterized protein n=1 Tax=Aspergillus leporis TaxID=41062 RepID=A0A5N5WKB8_9EURO|nr:hypothetical protein BDV29DRAFT_183612 [Aspergillus leporis]